MSSLNPPPRSLQLSPTLEDIQKTPYGLPIRSQRGADEGTLPLMENLHDAVHDLTASKIKPKAIWTDQTPSNQHNLDERGQQVILFGRIYQSASQAVVC
jgi:hypothetical protein